MGKYKLSPLCILICLLTSCNPTDWQNILDQNVTVFGHISNNQAYCGGAPPTQEILDELAIYHPSANTTFYVRSGTSSTPGTPILKSFTTDANGNFSITLPKGSYAVITSLKYEAESQPPLIDCSNWLTIPYFILEVNRKVGFKRYRYTQDCNPCQEPHE